MNDAAKIQERVRRNLAAANRGNVLYRYFCPCGREHETEFEMTKHVQFRGIECSCGNKYQEVYYP